MAESMDTNNDGKVSWFELNLFLQREREMCKRTQLGWTTVLCCIAAVPWGLFSRWLLLSHLLLSPLTFQFIFQLRPQNIHPQFFRLSTLLGVMFTVGHWFACAWYFIGWYEGFGANDWVPPKGFENCSLIHRYLKSLYWGFVNGTTIDTSNPETTLEIIFSITILFIGLLMFAILIGNISNILESFDAARSEFQDKIDTITSYLKEKRMPHVIRERVLSHYTYHWTRKDYLEQCDIQKDLPLSLQTDIAMHLHKDAFQKIPLFQTLNDQFLRMLARFLKPAVFSPGEKIVVYGDVGNELYFLQKGVCLVTDKEETKIFTVLTSGSFFGEYALLFSQKRSATVSAVTYCDLFVLSKEDFESVLLEFPEFRRIIKREGIKYQMSQLNQFKKFKESPDFFDDLVDVLEPMFVKANEYIVRAGEHGDEMFFVASGTLEVQNPKTKEIWGYLTRGSHFGEVALMSANSKRTADVVALEACELLRLHRNDYIALKAKYKEVMSDFEGTEMKKYKFTES